MLIIVLCVYVGLYNALVFSIQFIIGRSAQERPRIQVMAERPKSVVLYFHLTHYIPLIPLHVAPA